MTVTVSSNNGQTVFYNTRTGQIKELSQGCIDTHTQMLLRRMNLVLTPDQKKILDDDFVTTIRNASTIWE